MTLTLFLMRHDALNKFESNIKAQNIGFNSYESNTQSIARAFCWDNTPEGYDYWKHLDTLYDEILMEEIQK